MMENKIPFWAKLHGFSFESFPLLRKDVQIRKVGWILYKQAEEHARVSKSLDGNPLSGHA